MPVSWNWWKVGSRVLTHKIDKPGKQQAMRPLPGFILNKSEIVFF